MSIDCLSTSSVGAANTKGSKQTSVMSLEENISTGLVKHCSNWRYFIHKLYHHVCAIKQTIIRKFVLDLLQNCAADNR